MAAWYRRSKLGFDAICRYVTSAPKPPIQDIRQLGKKYYCSIRAPNASSSSSSKRYYYADSRQVRHFKPPWTNNPRKVLMVLAGSGIGLTVYFGNLESIPYTQRSHMVLMPHNLEKQMGESQFQNLKDGFKGKLLPPMHPDTRRVRMIARGIIQALPRGFKNKQQQQQTDEVNIDDSHDETRDKKKKKKKKKKSAISYLEVLVVDDHAVNAFSFPGGKIVVSTGLLQHLKTDQEIAAIIGHEVAHLVARHAPERIQKNLCSIIGRLILWCRLVKRNDWFVAVPYVLLKLPFSKRMEIEADYIGLLLMASAGYDPRVAPKVFEKLGQASSAFGDCLFTHSCGKKRSKLLDEASVMEEAVSVYWEAIAGREIDGFLL